MEVTVLRYTEIGMSHKEVPGEASLCIYLSGCPNHYHGCHYPELRDPSYVDPLAPVFDVILDLYLGQASCLCLLGEGQDATTDRAELAACAQSAHDRGMTSALYSGRNCEIEEWMGAFDYVKLGSYVAKRGPLSLATTNQRMLRQCRNGWLDITERFWRETARFRIDEILPTDGGMLAICGHVISGRVYHGDVIDIPTEGGQLISFWILHFGGIFFHAGEFQYVECGDNVALITIGDVGLCANANAEEVTVWEGMRPTWSDTLAWEKGFNVPSWAQASIADLGARLRSPMAGSTCPSTNVQ